jgi:hypothetical protein
MHVVNAGRVAQNKQFCLIWKPTCVAKRPDNGQGNGKLRAVRHGDNQAGILDANCHGFTAKVEISQNSVAIHPEIPPGSLQPTVELCSAHEIENVRPAPVG